MNESILKHIKEQATFDERKRITTNAQEKIKEILDKECWENWKLKECSKRSISPTRCYNCDKNYNLAKEIRDKLLE